MSYGGQVVARAPRNDGVRPSDSIVKQRIDMRPHSRGAMRPGVASVRTPRKQQEGAGKAGCALHPRSRVQTCTRTRTRAYRSSGEHPAFPAQWFTAYNVVVSVSRALLPPSPLRSSRFPRTWRQLRAPDHTLSPSAPLALVSRKPRVHRISTHVRDDSRSAPLIGWDGRSCKSDLPDGARGIFLIPAIDMISENQK
jgi:hypothetical protein